MLRYSKGGLLVNDLKKSPIKKSDWLAIPNILSLVRIMLIPVFIYIYFNNELSYNHLWAAAIVLLSGATDSLDGIIARRFDMITDLGKLLDPFADKLTQLAIIICLIYTWPGMLIVVSVFVIKELALLACSILLFRIGKVMDGALWYGKVSTLVFYACALILVAFPTMNQILANTLMSVTAISLLLAFVLYTRWFVIQLRK
ncbi:CDP-alcohol phosphatidyltransferase family protein [Aerococcaceae bacterium WS4759]|uniref:CDP-diacylglycerol--glycerol-3-phosphate 3-phosphatidyltransferase n=1 Tax=Fundicoccus ignavus TaxID=2664442 RepID=A0A6I2GZJ4_9LACT|nr:CDP-alcohol phosphatidyltransferase family protein [Fundicoccus ignavus]